MNEMEEREISKIEMKLEQEKMKLEHERILLERERLEAVRERVKMEADMRIGRDGSLSVRLSSVVLSSIVCLLLGGILGALSMSIRQERRGSARLQEVMQSLGSADSFLSRTNALGELSADAPAWLRAIKAQGGGSGISLIVVQ